MRVVCINYKIIFQKFAHPNNGTINYLEIDDWITFNQFRIQPYTEGFNCFQFELFGCPAGNLIFLYFILEYKYLEGLKSEHIVVTVDAINDFKN